MKEPKSDHLEKLDAETKAALEEGLKAADSNPKRWTSEEVKADAKKMAKEWREKVNHQASA